MTVTSWATLLDSAQDDGSEHTDVSTLKGALDPENIIYDGEELGDAFSD